MLTIHAAGDVALNSAFGIRSEQDLQRADVSIPAALILLVIVFGSLVAALLCLGVGLVAVAGGLAAMYALTHVTDVSTYALNVVVILGLGVAIDYSLFIVSRFREELRRQASVEAALSVTMRTAGTAVAYSGITVAVGATALLFYSRHHPHQHGAVGQLHGADRGRLRALLPPRSARHPRRSGQPLATGQPARAASRRSRSASPA